MFAWIETEVVPQETLWKRFRAWRKKETGVQWEETRRWGVRALYLRVTHTAEDSSLRCEKRMELAFQQIASHGVRVILPQRDFAYSEMARTYRLLPAEPRMLYRDMAAVLLEKILEQISTPPGKIRLVLCGNRLTGELLRVAETMILRTGGLAFCVPGRIGDTLRQLQLKYGVSVLENPSASQLSGANLFYVPEPPRQPPPLTETSITLWLDGTSEPLGPGRHCNGARLIPPSRLEPAPDFQAETLLTVLTAAGAVSYPEISVRELTWNEERLVF